MGGGLSVRTFFLKLAAQFFDILQSRIRSRLIGETPGLAASSDAL